MVGEGLAVGEAVGVFVLVSLLQPTGPKLRAATIAKERHNPINFFTFEPSFQLNGETKIRQEVLILR